MKRSGIEAALSECPELVSESEAFGYEVAQCRYQNGAIKLNACKDTKKLINRSVTVVIFDKIQK